MRDSLFVVIIVDAMYVLHVFTQFDAYWPLTLSFSDVAHSLHICMTSLSKPHLLANLQNSAVVGPKLGTRAMVHARYSWGCIYRFLSTARGLITFHCLT